MGRQIFSCMVAACFLFSAILAEKTVFLCHMDGAVHITPCCPKNHADHAEYQQPTTSCCEAHTSASTGPMANQPSPELPLPDLLLATAARWTDPQPIHKAAAAASPHARGPPTDQRPPILHLLI